MVAQKKLEMRQDETVDIQKPRMDIDITVYKPCRMFNESMYILVQLEAIGHANVSRYVRDNQGNNIFNLNSRYCEVTTLFVVVDNVKADCMGLVHYRRHFKGVGQSGMLTRSEAISSLIQFPLILPKKRNYYIETLASHYAHTFSQSQLDAFRITIVELISENLESYNRHLQCRRGHKFNMLIMRCDVLLLYCEVVFPILREAGKRVDFPGITSSERRLIGGSQSC